MTTLKVASESWWFVASGSGFKHRLGANTNNYDHGNHFDYNLFWWQPFWWQSILMTFKMMSVTFDVIYWFGKAGCMREAQSLLLNRLLVLSGAFHMNLIMMMRRRRTLMIMVTMVPMLLRCFLVRCSKHPCSASPCTNGGQCSAVRSLNMHISWLLTFHILDFIYDISYPMAASAARWETLTCISQILTFHILDFIYDISYPMAASAARWEALTSIYPES